MKIICLRPLTAQVLLGGVFLATLFAAGPSNALEAASSSTADEIMVAAQPQSTSSLGDPEAMPVADKAGKGKGGPMEKDCDQGPGVCASQALNPNPHTTLGCTAGVQCTVENKICDPGKRCKTVASGTNPITCYCACQ
jgi:hypothetical protein